MSKWLIVGLGNPGPEYAKTRHNLGFMLVGLLADQLNTAVKRVESLSLVGRAEIDNQVVELAMPQTFMNLSGQAVAGLLTKEGRSIERMVVISDDLALPMGSIRVRPRGTHGGQNGLRSIIDSLGTPDFTRLRIGIGPEHEIRDAARFVLDDFSKKEREIVDQVLAVASDAIRSIIADGVEAAMARFN